MWWRDSDPATTYLGVRGYRLRVPLHVRVTAIVIEDDQIRLLHTRTSTIRGPSAGFASRI